MGSHHPLGQLLPAPTTTQKEQTAQAGKTELKALGKFLKIKKVDVTSTVLGQCLMKNTQDISRGGNESI